MKIATASLVAAMASTVSAKKVSTARDRNSFMNAMKKSHDARGAHPTVSKHQTPSPETLAKEMAGDSKRARHLRKKVLEKAKPMPRKLQNQYNNNYNANNNQNNYNNNAYRNNNNNGQRDGADDYFVANGEWDNNFNFDVTQYSLSYHRCAAVQQYDDEVAQREDTNSVFATKRFAVFRLCPAKTCEGYRPTEDEMKYGEYLEQQAKTEYNTANGYYQAQYEAQQEAYENAPQYINGQWYQSQSVFDRLKVHGANGDGCQSNYGEYMLELEDYLEIMVEYHNERFDMYCETCEDCMYEVYQKWLKSGQQEYAYGNGNYRKLKAKSDSTWKDELPSDHRRLGFNVYNICPEYDTCSYYQVGCKNGLDETYSQYFECTEVERNNGQVVYIGPRCSEDGATITLGVYADEYCNVDISNGVNIENVLGLSMDEDADLAIGTIVSGSLADVIPEERIKAQQALYSLNYDEDLAEYYSPIDNMCIPCKKSRQPFEERGVVGDYVDQDDDQYDGTEVNELCENLYQVSARCDKHFRSYSTKSAQAMYAQAVVQEDLSCEFIESIVMGNYDEYGLINADNMMNYNEGEVNNGMMSNSMAWETYGSSIQEVTGMQIFSLIVAILACGILATWSYTLNKSASASGRAWRPRNLGSTSSEGPADVVDIARSESGPSTEPSTLEDRNRSYYMS